MRTAYILFEKNKKTRVNKVVKVYVDMELADINLESISIFNKDPDIFFYIEEAEIDYRYND